MKNLITDWVDLLWTPQIEFIKRHWVLYGLICLGYVFYCVFLVWPDFISDTFDKIKLFMKKTFSRKLQEEP